MSDSFQPITADGGPAEGFAVNGQHKTLLAKRECDVDEWKSMDSECAVDGRFHSLSPNQATNLENWMEEKVRTAMKMASGSAQAMMSCSSKPFS